jgi:hypothetical protein
MARDWPVIVYTRTNVVHISRENAPHGKVRTECGREIEHIGHYRGTPEDIRKADGQQLPKLHGIWNYRMCSRCGGREKFAEAQEEHDEAMEVRERERKETSDRLKKTMEEVQAAIRAVIASEVLYGLTGVDDVVNAGWTVSFTYNGMRMELKPSDEEIERMTEKIHMEVENAP